LKPATQPALRPLTISGGFIKQLLAREYQYFLVASISVDDRNSQSGKVRAGSDKRKKARSDQLGAGFYPDAHWGDPFPRC